MSATINVMDTIIETAKPSGTPKPHGLLWSSWNSWFSILKIGVFVLLLALSVLLFKASDYPFGIFNHSLNLYDDAY